MRALITGITGQDGSYLAELLLFKGYEVHGLIRRASTFNTGRIDHIYTDPHTPGARLFLHYGDISDASQITHLIYNLQPEEIYHLGAQSHVRVSFDMPEYTGDVTGLGTTRVLEAIRKSGVKSKFYQAASSEMFGDAPAPQSERTPFRPRSPYAAAKVYAFWITANYREGYRLFACNGILFNHESPLRGLEFVTREQNIGAEYQKAILDPWKATPFTALTGKAVYSRLHAFPQPTDEEARKFLNDGSVDTDFLKKNGISIVYTRGEVKNPDLTKVKENIYLLKK